MLGDPRRDMRGPMHSDPDRAHIEGIRAIELICQGCEGSSHWRGIDIHVARE